MASLSSAELAYQQAHIGDNRGQEIVAVSIFLIAISVPAVIFRFVARLARHLPLGWDDWLCIPALVMIVAECAINLVSVHFGFGKHVIATDQLTAYKILEAGWFLSVAYVLGHFFLKTAIVLTYIRIFTMRLTWFKWAIWACIFWNSAWALSLLITVLVECRPLNFYWEQANPANPTATGVCTINEKATEIVSNALSVVADIALLIIPLFVIWQLKLSGVRKFAVAAIFAVGAFACAASVFRLTTTLSVISKGGNDPTWDLVDVYLWTAVEGAVGLLCACFPVFGPLLSLWKNKMQSIYASRTSQTKSSGYMISRSKESAVSSGRPWRKVSASQDSTGASIDMEPLHTKGMPPQTKQQMRDDQDSWA
ncbi:hypothetical protein BJ878DRAFT_444496 [Calycina marina]|uniref:Rhodopsin domain-containing protein n=1 Tax=Calycina marina TaxID=1763456 RepID=A0A9P7Z080_9HELO|nr:hypothetical protein BJ878DRAFT_444496 [Calycina marina]